MNTEGCHCDSKSCDVDICVPYVIIVIIQHGISSPQMWRHNYLTYARIESQMDSHWQRVKNDRLDIIIWREKMSVFFQEGFFFISKLMACIKNNNTKNKLKCIYTKDKLITYQKLGAILIFI